VSGLDIIHKNGYIHRDIKPLNILKYKGGIIKIGDFGISKKIIENSDTITNTAQSTSINPVAGTLFYYLFIYFILLYFIYLFILIILLY
jgi:serine/threonine protein kinase